MMLASSEKFPEQFSRIQQQFKECTSFEQLYTIVELTRTLQLTYRHFLLQLYEENIQNESNDIFNHTVDDANSPDIVTCLLTNSFDKILFTLQLYLPLISTKTINEKLLDAYRDVLICLDKNLYLNKFSYSEQQIINLSQQILFFIQTNPNLNKLLTHIPKLIHLIKTNKFHSDEQHCHQPLQRHASIRSQIQQPLTNYSSEVLQNSTISQQLTRHETADSGIDLTEPPITNSFQNFISSQKQHLFVGKTASSPIPEHATLDIPLHVPLKSVLSEPPQTTYSDYRHRNLNYQQQKYISTLAKNHDDKQELKKQIEDFNSENIHPNDNSKPLGPFYSLHYRTVNNNQNTQNVSQYLGVEGNSAPVRNTFTQSNTSMKDVPKWLKHLRLHKYEFFFSQITYDEMMNLTIEQLKKFHITDGACTKILLNIKKLKERSTLLKQYLIDIDNGQADLSNIIQQLNEIMIAPIRSKQLAFENNSEEDLPKLIMQVLEKIYQQLISYPSSDICCHLLCLVDRCYKNDAFTGDQVHILLKWRRRLSNIIHDYKSTFVPTNQQRRSIKPSVRPMKSTSSAIYHSPNPIPIAKYNSEPQHNNLNESNLIRRPNKSPTLIYPTNEEINETNFQTTFTSITSSPQRNHGAYLANHQHQALTRKASIDPYGETNTINNHKLCKTFSDPNKIRFHNPTQINHMPFTSIRSQQNFYRMISTPYSQQSKQFLSRSPPISESPIQQSYTENENSDYYNNTASLSNASNTNNDIENTDEQRHNNTEIESLCRQITESAINDDVNDSSIDYKQETSNVSNTKQSLTNPADTEQ